MSYISEEILEMAENLSINIKKMPDSEAESLRTSLARLFSNEPNRPQMLSYQNLKEYSSICDDDAWKLIGDFAKKEPVLFFNSDDDVDMYEFVDGDNLMSILSETSGFPFYVTSKTANYLISYDDHD